jgi:hypothetical protein
MFPSYRQPEPAAAPAPRALLRRSLIHIGSVEAEAPLR